MKAFKITTGVGATVVASVLATMAFPLPADAAPAAVSRCGYQVTASTLRLRNGPGAQYKVLGLLVRGDMVDADGEQSGWYRVTVQLRPGKEGVPEGTKGWVAASHLEVLPCLHLD